MLPRSAAPAALALLAACALSSACASSAQDAQYALRRRDEMLAVYPPGKTTRTDVRARWSVEPDVVAIREDAGWLRGHPSAAARHAVASERRTGKPVARVERYSGPDPTGSSFISLCHGWFFYDDADQVIDVEWEYMSD
jgi:hypothetical protein